MNSPYGDVAFSNQPYNIDSGSGCGVGFVNSPGTLDGWTMTLGHEWHEMMSDQNPAGGWTNHTGSSYDGQENSDECAWLNPGTAGGAANVTMGTGTFAEQASWSNDTNACAISHPIVGGGSTGNTVTVTNPGAQSTTVNTAVSLKVSASDSASGQTLTYSATGLPAGLSINSSTGLISGTVTTVGTSAVSVTAKDSTGALGSTSFG
ncbi:Ig domain-containing protein [Streptomyces violascens]|uniref:Ig domain-containing protein n=1 Tax=Streptomyces violascens TaxID=67381 RepID=UPI003659D0DE